MNTARSSCSLARGYTTLVSRSVALATARSSPSRSTKQCASAPAKPTLPLFEPYPHQTLESAVFREPLSSTGTAGQLDRLYQRVIDDLDSVGRAVGLKVALRSIPNGNKIRVTGTIT